MAPEEVEPDPDGRKGRRPIYSGKQADFDAWAFAAQNHAKRHGWLDAIIPNIDDEGTKPAEAARPEEAPATWFVYSKDAGHETDIHAPIQIPSGF